MDGPMISLPTTWREFFDAAHEDGMLAFDALEAGDFDAAKALNESAKEANALAKIAHEREHG
jgi:hypothetical protein